MLRNELLHLPDHHSAPGHAAPSTPVTVKLSVIWRSVVYSGRLALRAAAGVERGSISLTPPPASYLKATATPDLPAKFGETYLSWILQLLLAPMDSLFLPLSPLFLTPT